MRVIIFGDKQFNDLAEFERIVKESGMNVTTILTPLSIGVCESSEQWAARNEIPICNVSREQMKQNELMLNKSLYDIADAAILIYVRPDKFSTIIRDEMWSRGKKVFIKTLLPLSTLRKNYKHCSRGRGKAKK